MKKKTLFTSLCVLLLAIQVPYTAMAAESFSTLEERMTDKEMQDTGLNKLTDQELARLNEWLRRHSVATLENAQARPASGGGEQADTRGFELKKNKKKDSNLGKTIHAHIVGAFSGWKGKGTLFKLDNGMVWKQAEAGTFAIREVTNPEITIKRGFLGDWNLSVVGYATTIRVKRVQ
ncbi:MAG: hypothetical protein PVF89_00260 [Lysobacterales bacterium]|jgi:hypothetical protein